jgi:hypothetical protein
MASRDLHYDTYQFQSRDRRRLPVSAWQEGYKGPIVSPGLDFNDYAHAHVVELSGPSAYRKTRTPLWVYDPKKVAEVLVTTMELRSWLRVPQPGTLQERLANARLHFDKAVRPRLIEIGTKLSREYVALRKANADPSHLRRLAIQIENIDRQLAVPDWAGTITRVVMLYYRVGMDSVAISLELEHRLSPPGIRQLLSRLNRIARELFDEEFTIPMRTWGRKKPKSKKPRVCRMCMAPITGRHRRAVCSDECARERMLERNEASRRRARSRRRLGR